MKQYPHNGNESDVENIIYRAFEDKADKFVYSLLNDYIPPHYSRSKVVHDCVWGSVMFYPWELQIMDSPLLQRLRKINQLGLAMYTYPSAHHSRFEHTLGVVAVAAKMIAGINSDTWGDDDDNFRISNEHIYLIRMAALLHDIGHCFFSHLSECIYSEMNEFIELKSSFEIFKKAQAHEILGYVIINTPTFKKFFYKYVDYPYKGDNEEITKSLLSSIGRAIVGAYVDSYQNAFGKHVLPCYLTEMINGQFDADALDYLRRDSYATGLDLTYNLDRFLYKIRIFEADSIIADDTVTEQHLTVPTSGVSTVEEMMYNKQMLTRYIYQHQKVMSIDSLVWDIAFGLISNGRLNHPCDFLYLCDDNIFMLQSSSQDFSLSISKLRISNSTSKTLSLLAQKIATRNLPKKALIINTNTIVSVYGKSDCSVLDISEFIQEHKKGLRESIYAEASIINSQLSKTGINDKCFDMFDIHIAIPKYSLAKDYSSVYVLSNDNNLVPLSSIVNLNDLANAFANHSWNAYVFADASILAIVSIAAKRVLERLGMVFDEGALSHLKHSHEIEDTLSILDR